MTARTMVARAVVGLMAAHVGLGGAIALIRSARHLQRAGRHLGEDPGATRRRIFGEAYTTAIEGLRRAIPPDGAYLLVDGQGREEGALYWLRFDLAPRRAILLGTMDELARATEPERQPLRETRFVVIAYGSGQPPRLVDGRALARGLADAAP